MNNSRKLVLWDIDDVLNQLMALWLATSAARLNVMLPSYDNLSQNPPHLLLGVEKEAYLASLDHCRANFLYSQPPREELLDFFREYGGKIRSMTLSCVPVSFAPRAAQWVLEYFGLWLQATLFVPSPRSGITVYSKTFASKAEAALALGGILVDDNPVLVEQTLTDGGEAILFPAPWNSNNSLGIEQFLDQLINKIK